MLKVRAIHKATDLIPAKPLPASLFAAKKTAPDPRIELSFSRGEKHRQLLARPPPRIFATILVMLQTLPVLASFLVSLSPLPTLERNSVPPETAGEVETLISWLLADGRDLDAIAFSDVVTATAGKEVVPLDLTDPDDRRVVANISRAADAVLAEINQTNHRVHEVGRINEVSRHVEDLLLKKLAAIDGFTCEYPQIASGRIQRSGYPDLRLLDEKTGRVFYLDPKLYATDSEDSTFRTFYFEPKDETNKILHDAGHLILGIAHGGRVDGDWVFLRWKLADLSDFTVRLKAEFQASNRDLYRPASIVAEGQTDAGAEN